MAKKGMKRPEVTHTQARNEVSPVPAIQGKAKHGKQKARPIIAGTAAPELKVYHERPVSGAYPAIDNDLARDNMVTAADVQDL